MTEPEVVSYYCMSCGVELPKECNGVHVRVVADGWMGNDVFSATPVATKTVRCPGPVVPRGQDGVLIGVLLLGAEKTNG